MKNTIREMNELHKEKDHDPVYGSWEPIVSPKKKQNEYKKRKEECKEKSLNPVWGSWKHK